MGTGRKQVTAEQPAKAAAAGAPRSTVSNIRRGGAAMTQRAAEARQRAAEQSERTKASMGGVQGKAFQAAKARADAPKTVALDPEDVAAQAEITRQENEFVELTDTSIFGGTPNIPTVPTGTNERALGAGAGGGGGSRTVTRSNAPPQVAAEMLRGLDLERQAVGAQLSAQAAGMGIRADIYKDYALAQQEEVFPILQEVQGIFDDANRQLVGVQQMVDDVRANRINPGQFFANIGEAGVFAASMAVAAGHLAASLGGGPNTALSVINGAIERNMRAQTLNQAHDRALLQSEIMIFDRMRALGVDRLNQANVYNALLLSQAQNALESAAAATASVSLRHQVGIVQAQIAQKKQEFLMRYYGTVQTTVQMQLAGGAQAAQQAAMQTVGEVFGEQMSGISVDPNAEFTPPPGIAAETPGTVPVADLTPDQQEQLFARIRQELGKEGRSLTDQQIGFLAMNEKAFAGATVEDLRATEAGDIVTSHGRDFIKSEQLKQLKPEEQAKKNAQFRATRQVLGLWQELYSLSRDTTAGSGVAGWSKWVAYSEEEGFGLKGGSSNAEINQRVARVTQLLNQITSMEKVALSGRLEAMRGQQEYVMFQLQALIPPDPSTLVTMISDGEFTDQIAPALRAGRDRYIEKFDPFYTNLSSSIAPAGAP
jgi:hypothetical protein